MTDEMRRLLCSEKSATFLPERKSNQLSQCFVNKTYIIKTEWKGKGSVVLSYVLVCKRCTSVNFSHVSLNVYVEFLRAQMYVILIFAICSLLVRVDCVADKLELE